MWYGAMQCDVMLYCMVCYDVMCSSEASPTIWSCYANLDHYHYSFLQKLIPYMVYKHKKFTFK